MLKLQQSSYMANLQNEPDEEIVKLAKNGDEFATEYLISKYKNFVRVKAKSYFLVGADREDIIQEGMIGLYKSIRDYRGLTNCPLSVLSPSCVSLARSLRLSRQPPVKSTSL